jgi:NADPH-ferrihemoprotein reductase
VQFAPSPSIGNFLDALAKNDAAYLEFSQASYVTFGRLLELTAKNDGLADEAAWQALPLPFVVEALRPLQPRLYSISSSSMISPKTPSITALVVKTPLSGAPDQSIHGLTSNYLRSALLLANSQAHLPDLSHAIAHDPMPRLHVSIRKSSFRPPASTRHIIMVSAGTGVAPFRGFLLERARLHAMARPVGQTLLFFGCRSPDEDYIYREEIESTALTLPGAEVIPVFSRVKYDGKPGRGYVQDAVRARAEELCSMILDQGARVYVCGRAAMSRDVASVLKEAVGIAKGWKESERDEWWTSWRRQGGFLEDVWG